MASHQYDVSRFHLSLPKIGKLTKGVNSKVKRHSSLRQSVVHLRGGSDTADSQTDVSLNWQRSIGVCYYPEHWPRDLWEKDASDMAALGIKYVRIGEFMWSTIQPAPPPPPPASAVYDWTVLDDAIEVLGRHGLKVVLGTPTACPPKWLIDAHPDVLPYDARETPRKFGSRRHYSFSSPTFREHTTAVCGAMAERYGKHPAVVGWQLDNEYGCHDTVRTYDPGAQRAFRTWLAARYGSIAALNAAWGSKFWSSEYRSFDEVDLPCGTVTEPSPSHRLDFFRFSSDQVSPPPAHCARPRERRPRGS
jgi:beta-galactosidase